MNETADALLRAHLDRIVIGLDGFTKEAYESIRWGGRFRTPMDVSIEDRIPCPWAMTMMHVFRDGRVPRCPGDTEGDEGVGNAEGVRLAMIVNRTEKKWDRLLVRDDDPGKHGQELLSAEIAGGIAAGGM